MFQDAHCAIELGIVLCSTKAHNKTQVGDMGLRLKDIFLFDHFYSHALSTHKEL